MNAEMRARMQGAREAPAGHGLPAENAWPVETALPAEPVRIQGVGTLAAGLAQDLNSMLGGIVATAELLQLRLGDANDASNAAETRQDLGAIVDQATRASNLIRKILAFSRQDTLVPVTAGLDALLDGFAGLLDTLVVGRARLLRERGPDVLVRIDPAALERAVVNLVMNARDAVGRQGRIRISTARVPPGLRPEQGRAFMPAVPYAALRVEDNGPGVRAAHLARIFDPYFTTRRDSQGLGLAMAFGLVKQSGGFLLYDRSPLGGARFTVYLPEAPAERLPDRREAPPEVPVIALVDDDPMQRMATARGLERLGYRVWQAANGEAALARMPSDRPALMLAEIGLPGIDGLELTRRVRRIHPDLPVLLMAGFLGEAARAALPGLGVAFLSKPFTLKMLAARISELIA